MTLLTEYYSKYRGAVCGTRKGFEVYASFATHRSGFLTGVSYLQFAKPGHVALKPEAMFWDAYSGEEDGSDPVLAYSLNRPECDIVAVHMLITRDGQWLSTKV